VQLRHSSGRICALLLERGTSARCIEREAVPFGHLILRGLRSSSGCLGSGQRLRIIRTTDVCGQYG
jgi:hypothetical protein